MTWLVEPPASRPHLLPTPLEVCESSGTVIIRIRGCLDANTAREVHRSVVSQTERAEIATVEIDLREMDRWTSAGLRELGTCAGRRVRFRLGPNVATAHQ